MGVVTVTLSYKSVDGTVDFHITKQTVTGMESHEATERLMREVLVAFDRMLDDA